MHEWRRHLPHIEADGATYFLTFCLHQDAPVDLTEPRFGVIVVGALRHFAGVRYILFDYTAMPDHVHVILKPMVERPKSSLEAILHSIKSFTANQINELSGATAVSGRTRRGMRYSTASVRTGQWRRISGRTHMRRGLWPIPRSGRGGATVWS